MCTHIAAKVFALNGDRQSVVIDPDGEAGETVLEAAETCPVSAITVLDAETAEQLSP